MDVDRTNNETAGKVNVKTGKVEVLVLSTAAIE